MKADGPVHALVAVRVVYCQDQLVEDIEGELLGQGAVGVEEFEGVLGLEVLGDHVVVGAVLEHLVHLDDVGVVLA